MWAKFTLGGSPGLGLSSENTALALGLDGDHRCAARGCRAPGRVLVLSLLTDGALPWRGHLSCSHGVHRDTVADRR